jgi:hypothetical protein
MNRCLIPEVRANSYDILFTPVLYQDQKVEDLTQHSLFIIEIRVRPLMVSYQNEMDICNNDFVKNRIQCC